jgi:hypothetical protein
MDEKQFRTDLRMDKAIRERMERRRRETREMRQYHDSVKRRIDETAKRLGK